jgi:hypothetical protein
MGFTFFDTRRSRGIAMKKPRTGERQKRVNDNYRAGWDSIWRKSAAAICADRARHANMSRVRRHPAEHHLDEPANEPTIRGAS